MEVDVAKIFHHYNFFFFFFKYKYTDFSPWLPASNYTSSFFNQSPLYQWELASKWDLSCLGVRASIWGHSSRYKRSSTLSEASILSIIQDYALSRDCIVKELLISRTWIVRFQGLDIWILVTVLWTLTIEFVSGHGGLKCSRRYIPILCEIRPHLVWKGGRMSFLFLRDDYRLGNNHTANNFNFRYW